MKFRAKLTIAMVLLLSLTYGIGGSLMIAQSFSSSIDRERDAAVQTYRMVVDVLDLLGDNASPGTAANTVALVLHKLGSGGSSTAARIRFGAQMTTTGDTALLDAAPEPSDGGDGLTRIVRTGNGRHYLMLGATADGTTVQLAFDVTEAYTVRQTQQRAYHTTFVILIAIGAAVSWVTSYLLTRPLGTLHACQIDILGGFPARRGSWRAATSATGRPCARATRWGSWHPTSTVWPGSSSRTSTAFRRAWRCRSGSWPTSRTR